jgi:hypothetical protein
MQDEWKNICADLVSLKNMEPFLLRLLTGHVSGEWVQVEQACRESGLVLPQAMPDVVATWLLEPSGAEDFVLILFYDMKTYESLVAVYNRHRLLASQES